MYALLVSADSATTAAQSAGSPTLAACGSAARPSLTLHQGPLQLLAGLLVVLRGALPPETGALQLPQLPRPPSLSALAAR